MHEVPVAKWTVQFITNAIGLGNKIVKICFIYNCKIFRLKVLTACLYLHGILECRCRYSIQAIQPRK